MLKNKKGFTLIEHERSKSGGRNEGFTLIELLIVIGILAILMGTVIVAVNPIRQFAMANNSQRWTNITTILNAVSQNIVDNRGIWTCVDYPTLPASATLITNTGADICNCLVPKYIAELPVDPTAGSYTDCTVYDAGYNIFQNPTTGRIIIEAPFAQSENGEALDISVSR